MKPHQKSSIHIHRNKGKRKKRKKKKKQKKPQVIVAEQTERGKVSTLKP
jgi:hypothetical protein